ncbi:MAG: tyrosine-type recombinase/integrase [Deltaproteobacteria bacterium]
MIRVSHRRDPRTGTQVRISRTVRGTRRQAEQELKRLLEQKERRGPTPVSQARLTLDAWIRHRITTADLAARTRKDQVDLWDQYSTPALRAMPLRDVTTAMLRAHIADLRRRVSKHTGRALAPRTVQMYFNVIRAALTMAVEDGVISENPAVGISVKGGGKQSKIGAALTPEEMQRFLAVEPGHRLGALWYVAAYTGVRPSELLALRWEDWDEAAGLLHIRRSLVRINEELYWAPCKAESERTVPVATELAATLRDHRKRQAQERLNIGPGWVDSSLMFTTAIGSPLERHNVARMFRARANAAKLGRPIRWYDLRHSFGTHAMAASGNAKVVAQLMGHANVTMTLQHYTHPDEAEQRATVARLPWQALPGARQA